MASSLQLAAFSVARNNNVGELPRVLAKRPSRQVTKQIHRRMHLTGFQRKLRHHIPAAAVSMHTYRHTHTHIVKCVACRRAHVCYGLWLCVPHGLA